MSEVKKLLDEDFDALKVIRQRESRSCIYIRRIRVSKDYIRL